MHRGEPHDAGGPGVEVGTDDVEVRHRLPPEAVGLAADLQFSAAIPVARYVEYLTPCAYIDELTSEPFTLDADGLLTIPDRPGLGIEIDPNQLKHFCPEPIAFS